MRMLTLAAGLASALAFSAAPAFAHDSYGSYKHRHVKSYSYGYGYKAPSYGYAYKAPTYYAPTYYAPSYEPKVVYVAPPTYFVKKVHRYGYGH